MIYNVVLVLGIEHSELVIQIPTFFFIFFSHIGFYRVEFPVLYSRFLLVTCLIYSSVNMSVTIYTSLPPAPGNYKFVFYVCDSAFVL